MFRKAVMEDSPELAKLFLEHTDYHYLLQGKVFNKQDINSILPEGWLKEILDSPATHIIVSDENRQLSGLVMFTEEETDDDLYKIKEWIHINEIAVKKDKRNKGIGKKLLNEVENHAKRKGIKSVRLKVWSNNKNAMGFYEKNDYRLKQHIYWKDI